MSGQVGSSLNDCVNCSRRSLILIVSIANLAQSKQYGPAVVLAEQLTREYPSHAPGHAWLGSAHARLGHRDKAKRALERALKLDPENTQAQRELLLLDSGR